MRDCSGGRREPGGVVHLDPGVPERPSLGLETLEPTSPAIPAPGPENDQHDDDDQKCLVVHVRLSPQWLPAGGFSRRCQAQFGRCKRRRYPSDRYL